MVDQSPGFVSVPQDELVAVMGNGINETIPDIGY